MLKITVYQWDFGGPYVSTSLAMLPKNDVLCGETIRLSILGCTIQSNFWWKTVHNSDDRNSVSIP
jgi:hypothetical protein